MKFCETAVVESAVFKLWMLYFQRIPFSDYLECVTSIHLVSLLYLHRFKPHSNNMRSQVLLNGQHVFSQSCIVPHLLQMYDKFRTTIYIVLRKSKTITKEDDADS